MIVLSLDGIVQILFVNVIYCHQQYDSLMPIRSSRPKQMDDIFELDYQSTYKFSAMESYQLNTMKVRCV